MCTEWTGVGSRLRNGELPPGKLDFARVTVAYFGPRWTAEHRMKQRLLRAVTTAAAILGCSTLYPWLPQIRWRKLCRSQLYRGKLRVMIPR